MNAIPTLVFTCTLIKSLTQTTLKWVQNVPEGIPNRSRGDSAGDGARSHGGRHRYGLPPHDPLAGRLRADHDRVHQLARRAGGVEVHAADADVPLPVLRSR